MNSFEQNLTEMSMKEPKKELLPPVIKNVTGKCTIFDRKATVHLIECVRKRPKLWQRQFLRKRQLSCQSEWEDIQRKEFPACTVDQLKARWKTIRDSFRREAKRIECGEYSQSRWALFKDVAFLEGHFRPRKSLPTSFAKRKVTATGSKESFAVKPKHEAANDRAENCTPKKETAHNNERVHGHPDSRTTIFDVNDVPVGISEVTYSNKFRTRMKADTATESTRAGQHIHEQEINNRQFLLTLVPFFNILPMETNLELRLRMLQLIANATQIGNSSGKKQPQFE